VFNLKYAIDDAADWKRDSEATLICGITTAKFLANIRKFFEDCRQAGITLNLQKVQWDQPKVLFERLLLDSTGYKIDSSLTKALSKLPALKSPTDVSTFLV
jgi:hypothetical protein